MATRPTKTLDWMEADTPDTADLIEPSAAKKANGYQSAEKPPYQYGNFFRWIFNKVHKYFDEVFHVEHQEDTGFHKLISVPDASVGNTIIYGKLIADTIARIGLIVSTNGGQIVLGDGTVLDIRIGRDAAKTLTIDDNSSLNLDLFTVKADESDFTGRIQVTVPSAGADSLKALVSGDSIARIGLIPEATGGAVVFGPGTAIQINLHQTAANVLTLDNNSSGDITKLNILAADTDFSGDVNLGGALVVGNDVILDSAKALYAPNVEGSVKSQGSNTSVSSGKLIDSSATFSTDSVVAGDIVRNDTTYAKTTVVTVDSETQLTLSVDIFTSTGNPYRVVIKDTANSGKFLGGNGGFMWFDGVTPGGTTAITLDSTLDWRDRWISITARIAFYATPSDYVPGGTFDNTLTGHLGQLSGSLAAFVTDFLATTFYSEAGSTGGGALPHGKLSNVDADDVDIWADSTNGDLKLGKPLDTGDEAAFGLFVIFSDDQGHY